MNNLKEVLLAAYKAEIKNDVPLPATLKKHLVDFIEQNKTAEQVQKIRPTLYHLLDRFISGEVKAKKGKERSQGSLDNYDALKKHLKAFEAAKGYSIDFDTVTLDFFESYTTFLKKQYSYKTRGEKDKTITGVSENTIAKDISLLKAVMNKGITLGHHANLAHKHEDFSFSEVETGKSG